MEKKTRKKRSGTENPGKEGKDTSKTQSRSSLNTGKSSFTRSEVQISSGPKILDIPLNPETAKQAVILSEIIGKPLSKRSIRR